jgi:hypothetical protein
MSTRDPGAANTTSAGQRSDASSANAANPREDKPPSSPPSDAIFNRICAEYAEMPGLRVTRQQAQRLWGLDEDACIAALEHLIQTGFLCRTFNGHYARLTNGPTIFPPLRMASAKMPQRRMPRIAS